MNKKTRPPVWLICLTAVMFALGAFLYFADSTQSEATNPLIGKHTESLGQLTMDSKAAQTFTASADGLISVDAMVTTYAKKVSTGMLRLTLLDDAGKTVAEQEFPAATLKNTAFVTLVLPDVQKSAGKTYTLTAVSDITDQKGISLRTGPAENVGTLTMADGTTDTASAMNIRLTYRCSTPGTMACMTCVLIGLCCLAALCLPGKEKRHD